MEVRRIKNNEELNVLISQMDPSKDLYAIRTKTEILVFKREKRLNKVAKKLPNAVQGVLNPRNYMYYRFVTF